MSSLQRSRSSDPPEKVEYTVNQIAKVHREKIEDPRPSVWYSVVKWTFGVFLFISVLTCLVASKISLLCIANVYKNSENGNDHTNRETVFIMVVLTLMLPEAVSFFKACWISLFRKSHRWPRAKAIIVGLVAGVLEVSGLCYFTMIILLSTNFWPVMLILMMNAVFIIPVIWQIYKNRSCNQEQYSYKQLGTFIFALLLEVAGVAVLMFKVHQDDGQVIVWGIPPALIFISIAWCPMMFKFIMEPSGQQSTSHVEELAGMTNTLDSGVSSASPTSDAIILEQVSKAKSARGKAAIITSLWKLVLIPFVSVLLSLIPQKEEHKIANLADLRKGFDEFTYHHKAFPYFMTQIFTSFIGYFLGILACSMCMQRLAFALPMLFATPVSLALSFIFTVNNIFLSSDSGKPYEDPMVYTVAVLLLLAQFITVSYYLFKEQGFIMAKESSLFWMPTYNGKIH
ncbi:hypothetical protein P5673_011169 [Acropora cervicornis]|uniref:Uncharacterized protein n=1 Tax=Acropora cervicornis TaxID=6130 RepID=A0AAD9QPW8_ACRCE|nr:hypothetical protein P5673_011169 [Acropora cervicornis]